MIKYVDEYRSPDVCMKIADEIKRSSTKKMNIMEVCGGHTMAIRKNGIHKMVGDNIAFLSGPGCPVCVTSIQDVDTAIALADGKDVVLCTFGDLFYVPGTETSLAKKKADDADVRVVYSVYDALRFAKEEASKNFVFISLGFETTAPTVAAAILQAHKEGVKNFYVLALNKTMPNALRALLGGENSSVDALICPGHVSTITGIGMYRFIVDEFNMSCCVSGFEPMDLLLSVLKLNELHENNTAELVNNYSRSVKDEGNIKAQDIMYKVFENADASWRGIGIIPGSGLKLKEEYSGFNPLNRFKVLLPDRKENTACICGSVLKGESKPTDCALYGSGCTPENPQGACMVSSEGACAAWYKYGE